MIKKPSDKIIQMWKDEGWEFDEYEEGFSFNIKFPFMKFIRTITVYFENQEGKNYYYINTQTHAKDNSDSVYEYLYVEMKEHMMVHKTLLDLGWINTNEIIEEEKPQEKTLFDF